MNKSLKIIVAIFAIALAVVSCGGGGGLSTYNEVSATNNNKLMFFSAPVYVNP